MKRYGIAAVIAVAVALSAAGTAAALSTQGSRQPAASTAPLPVAYSGMDGWSHGRVRPPVIYLSGSAAFLRIAHWARWTTSAARGQATVWMDTCQPNCAAGHYRTYPATLDLSQPATHKGVSFFFRMRLRYWHGGQRDYGFRWGSYPGATVPVWIGGPGSR